MLATLPFHCSPVRTADNLTAGGSIRGASRRTVLAVCSQARARRPSEDGGFRTSLTCRPSVVFPASAGKRQTSIFPRDGVCFLSFIFIFLFFSASLLAEGGHCFFTLFLLGCWHKLILKKIEEPTLIFREVGRDMS